MRFSAKAPQFLKDRAETKQDKLLQQFINARPSQISAYIDANMPSLSVSERKIIKTLAMVVSVLARKEFK